MNSNNEITTAIDKEGLRNQPWWVEQWMELINSYRFKKRLERAWTYAREGNVTSIRFEGRRVHARVQGTEKDPYKIKLWLDVLNDEDWEYVLEALAQNSRWSALLLAGIMPKDIERAFAVSGKRLFPFKLQEVKSECTCPDQANPCKHISAIYFVMGERFREDPFVLFQLRGRNKIQLLEDLAEQREKLLMKGDQTSLKQNEGDKNQIQPTINNPNLWWTYKGELNDDLVIITPAMEGDTGIDAAGDLPLAEDPKFPKACKNFINHIKKQGEILAQKAMINAMSTNDQS